MISVVVPIYISKKESLPMTEKCLTIARDTSTMDIEWVIVETETDFFKDYADVHIYEKKRTTCTKSINKGFKVASGEHIVLLTNDVYLKEGWDEALKSPFEEKADCGMTTLGTTQHKHVAQNRIEEGVWCSVFMIPRKALESVGYFDENYVNSWDDTDLVMSLYEQGRKMYRNYNVVVDHLVGATHYEDAKHMENYRKNEEYFKKKHERYKDHRMYKILTEGWVI